MGLCESADAVECYTDMMVASSDCADGFYNYEANMLTLENDVGDFSLLCHDVLRELLSRCSGAIEDEDSAHFSLYWEQLVDFIEIHHTLFDGHIPEQTKRWKGLFEVLFEDDHESIGSLTKCQCELIETETVVSLTLVQEGWGENLHNSFHKFHALCDHHLTYQEGLMIPKMLEVRHWRREFQENVLPPALKLDFGWFIGFGVQILDDLTQNSVTGEDCKVAEWIQVFYKLATKRQWQRWHLNIHESLLAQHVPTDFLQSSSVDNEYTFE